MVRRQPSNFPPPPRLWLVHRLLKEQLVLLWEGYQHVVVFSLENYTSHILNSVPAPFASPPQESSNNNSSTRPSTRRGVQAVEPNTPLSSSFTELLTWRAVCEVQQGGVHHWQAEPRAPTRSMSNTHMPVSSSLLGAPTLWRHEGVSHSVVLLLSELLMLLKSWGLKKGGIRS